MKKTILILLSIVGLVGGFFAWKVFGPTVTQPEGSYFYIKTGSDYNSVRQNLQTQGITNSLQLFDFLSKRANYTSNVKAGRYKITGGMSLYNLVRMLKSGNQSPVKLVINKIRTKEDFAGKFASLFELDSTNVLDFLLSNDSLKKFDVDTNTVMTLVVPNTYEIRKWNTPLPDLLKKLKTEKKKFWNEERTNKAKKHGLTEEQVYTIASIVEEETNKADDKGKIASVYINRKNTGMKLQADPTVKYAMRDFGIKRVLHRHLEYPSPYNTYYASGFPPGPICTPSPATIDAVLNSPETDYIYFVAKPDFSGYSNFANNYQQHMVYAKAYQAALDSLIRSKQK